MTAKIYAAMAKVMAEVAPVAKDKKNTMQGYQFRGIDDIYNALNAIMSKNGVVSVPNVLEAHYGERKTDKGNTMLTARLKIQYTFYADDGSSVVSTVVGEGHDSGDKASNKAMAVAHKYALLQAFCIPTEEPKDPEANENSPDKAEAALSVAGTDRWKKAVKAFGELGVTEAAMCARLKKSADKVTSQDLDILAAWHDELKRGDHTA